MLEILRARPWIFRVLIEIVPGSLRLRRKTGYGDDKKKEDVGLLKRLWNMIFGVFDPRDESEWEDDEDDRDWVTEEEWKTLLKVSVQNSR